MSFLRRLFRLKHNGPVRRVRICIECGMPLPEHKDWCSIFRTLRAVRSQQASLSTGV